MCYAREIIDYVGDEMARHMQEEVRARRLGDAAAMQRAHTRALAVLSIMSGISRLFAQRATAGADALEFIRAYGPTPPQETDGDEG